MAGRTGEHGLEDVFLTLYNSGMDAKVLGAEGAKRIARTIARLDKGRRKVVEDDASYRLERWREYTAASPAAREEARRLERAQGITREEAFERVRTRKAA